MSLTDHLNPAHDLDRIKCINDQFSLRGYAEYGAGLLRSLVRGGAYGAALGGAIGVFTDKPAEGAMVGGVAVAIIDMLQYKTQYLIEFQKLRT